MNKIDLIAAVLVIVGAINWGLVGVADFNLVTALFGATIISAVVFVLVGLAGIYLATRLPALTSRSTPVPARA